MFLSVVEINLEVNGGLILKAYHEALTDRAPSVDSLLYAWHEPDSNTAGLDVLCGHTQNQFAARPRGLRRI